MKETPSQESIDLISQMQKRKKIVTGSFAIIEDVGFVYAGVNESTLIIN